MNFKLNYLRVQMIKLFTDDRINFYYARTLFSKLRLPDIEFYDLFNYSFNIPSFTFKTLSILLSILLMILIILFYSLLA